MSPLKESVDAGTVVKHAADQSAILERANKTAYPRTQVALCIAYRDPLTLMVSIVAASCLPHEWAENIENFSNDKIKKILQHLPNCFKSNLKTICIAHAVHVADGNSIPVITPAMILFETAITVKLAVQAVNRSLSIHQELAEDEKASAEGAKTSTLKKAARTMGERGVIALTNLALAHMISKGQNASIAGMGATAAATFPKQAKELHDSTYTFINRVFKAVPMAIGALVPTAYVAHEAALKYMGPVPYVTEIVIAAEAATSFYFGAKLMITNQQHEINRLNAQDVHQE